MLCGGPQPYIDITAQGHSGLSFQSGYCHAARREWEDEDERIMRHEWEEEVEETGWLENNRGEGEEMRHKCLEGMTTTTEKVRRRSTNNDTKLYRIINGKARMKEK